MTNPSFSSLNQKKSIIDFDSPKIKRYNQFRYFKDKLAKVTITLGGLSVISAILLIFLYLLHEVVPLFESANMQSLAEYSQPVSDASLLYTAVEEQNEIAIQLFSNGSVVFLNTQNGATVSRQNIALPVNVTISSVSANSEESHLLVLGLTNGTFMLVKHQYMVSYPNDKRLIVPIIDYPFGRDALPISLTGKPLIQIALRDKSTSLLVMAFDGDKVNAIKYHKEEDFLSDAVTLVPSQLTVPDLGKTMGEIAIDVDQNFAYLVVEPKKIAALNLASGQVSYIKTVANITDIQFLLGGISLLVADESGNIGQWFLVRDNNGEQEPKHIRNFDANYQGKTLLLAVEQRRKGFVAVTGDGKVELFFATAHRKILSKPLITGKTVSVALSPRANRLLVVSNTQQIQWLAINNPHPEISWSSLWQKVWYESYSEPQYTWQSSAATNDFEQKLSLMPLSFGTLKAAFYAMLFGAPLAICAAIYTAYFMTPVMRRKIKPLVELMEALPTVILGFLAGLWLAPFIEKQLVGIFSVFILMPLAILLFAYAMSRLPVKIQNRINDGWHGFILIPFILLVGSLCFWISPTIEILLFGGDMPNWLTHKMGIPFDQRNALVVGVAMGFAIIPTIFSISEDAVFSVPKHLSYGSLALGATPWQTLVGVVLPTASPGIFSALMIGLGRAVGETMIVLMATGNTPIMDANIFEGMRTLSANLAVEIPEAEVKSTHYRVLFLAAFVLFSFTFVLNTLAEIIRQRLRTKYGSL